MSCSLSLSLSLWLLPKQKVVEDAPRDERIQRCLGFDSCNASLFCLTPGPLGGVRNLQVTDPTTSTLNVVWEAAEGNVRQYKVFYVPAAGGEDQMVSWDNAFESMRMVKRAAP